jgi:hypothetical protein
MFPLTVEQEQHKDKKAIKKVSSKGLTLIFKSRERPAIRSGRVSVVARKATEGRAT